MAVVSARELRLMGAARELACVRFALAAPPTCMEQVAAGVFVVGDAAAGL